MLARHVELVMTLDTYLILSLKWDNTKFNELTQMKNRKNEWRKKENEKKRKEKIERKRRKRKEIEKEKESVNPTESTYLFKLFSN